jgi:hypothetical protein
MEDTGSEFWFTVGLFVGTTYGILAVIETRLTEEQPKAREIVGKLRALVDSMRDRPILTDLRLDWSEEAIEISKAVMNWQLVLNKAVELNTDLSYECLQSNLIYFQLRPFL